ncbi:MAG TPA: NAD(P)-dependent oxidoreductase, partial [Thermoanaerobaculia bacterium]|nr:NAD(P)-dependent oxidoreductase [Thermoanaerobaculia bacterium]
PLREKFFPYGGEYEKILVERAAARMPATILRLPAVYGPGDDQHRLSNLDAGHPRWRWTRGYVENVADAILLAAQKQKTGIYNVGEPDTPTEAEWIEMCGGALQRAGRRPEGRRYTCDLVVDSTKIRRELGYQERTPRKDAIAATMRWEQKSKASP